MIGRKRELQELNELYDSGKAELVAVYGRRRVGKTYLIDEAFRDKMAFRHAGLSPVEHEKKGLLKKQLDGFYFSLLRCGMKDGKKPKSWMEAFFMLEMFLDGIATGDRQVVFLDELPWMDTQRSGFLVAFENFWNGWACYHKNVMVIVCGSANSWILDNLINNHGGLYGRVTYEIRLEPFTLHECEMFLVEKGVLFSRYDIVQGYMAVGGIPYYLGYFRKELSLAQNLDLLFFARQAKLRDEFHRLFASIFERPEIMKAIVRELYKRRAGLSRSEILEALHTTEGEGLANALNALVASEFVEKYVPFGEKKNLCLYKLTDPFCLFYLTFVERKEGVDEAFWSNNLASQEVVSWRGLAFENTCFLHIPQIKNALGISGLSTLASAWTKKPDDAEGMQIDLLLVRKDDIVNLCEMKYYKDEVVLDGSYYRTMLRRVDAVATMVPKTTAVHTTLITTFGLKKNTYSGVFTNIITMEDLFS